MTPSFRGFLSRYCKELTASNTTSLKNLFLLANAEYPRAIEPLLLLAICEQRESYLLKQAKRAKDTSAFTTYQKFLSSWKSSNMSLEEYLDTLEETNRFRRPLTAWQAEKSRLSTDRKVLLQVSSALLSLLEAKQITRAQACRLTNVNKGNFYAFLKGDPSKLSRKTAMRIYRQLEKL